jgi:predicted ATP-grasp superfamily ATP-dependent carboligase
MVITGSYRGETDDSVYVWMRRFENEAEAIAKYRMLTSWWWQTKRLFSAVRLREQSAFGPYFKQMRPVVNVQQFVGGRPANSAFACWKGEVLGAIHVEVLQESFPTGPASVVRTIDNPEMDRNARKIASHFRLSGIHGLDYMLDETLGVCQLIEMNPRLTQIAHLPLGEGRDLVTGLLSAITGERNSPRLSNIRSRIIALFPHEWLRDENSAFFDVAHQDVPWENAEFVKLFLGRHASVPAGSDALMMRSAKDLV